jgi:hypothetical protein
MGRYAVTKDQGIEGEVENELAWFWRRRRKKEDGKEKNQTN